ncbi:MAG: glycosyltransferase family 2 protein [Muribaculaceae bacterium]|nr:glycosyltransferase family 2 protein [Muribaculaceae bacterium]MBR1727023.1 glycosyltransferase family 2 protein [Muribaculaceae bacterium]
MPAISIVIPIYNVADYLRQCLDSIGLFGDDRVEVLLVNDGSTDTSPNICEEYQDKYCNVKVINKPNGGLSDARNAGTREATGQWIYYLDSDDWLAPGAIMKLYDFAIKNSCDVVQGGFYYAYSDHLLLDERYVKASHEPYILDRETTMRELIVNNYIKNFAWGKLYRADIVKRHPFPVGKYFEDSFWQHLIVHETRRYGVMPEPLYYYRQREESISGGFSLHNMDLLRGNEERLKFLSEHYPQLQTLEADKLWRLSEQFLTLAQRMGNEKIIDNYKLLFDYINHEYINIYSNKLKKSVLFRLRVSNSPLLESYRFLKRVVCHFNSRSLTRIDNHG